MKYKGWIPVASGYLSFSNIRGQVINGRCKEPPKFEGSLESVGKNCKVTSTRILIDRPFGELRSIIGGYDERYDFELCAERVIVDGDEALIGTVIAHPMNKGAEAISLKNNPSISPGIYPNCLGWVLSFTLSRDGCITLDWGNLDTGKILQIVEAPVGGEDAAENLLTFETFSFLKDLIHNHKFHSVDDDSIVVPIKIRDEEDCAWKDETARGLHRAVISAVRSKPAQLELANALGKIGYLRTFLALAKTPFTVRLGNSLDNLERTVQARIQQEGFRTSASDVLRTTVVTILVACIATAMTMFQLFQIPCIEGLSKGDSCAAKGFAVPDSALQLTSMLLGNWTAFFWGIFALLAIIGYLATRKSILELYSQRTGSEEWDWHLMRFFYGLALTQGRYMALFWLTVLTAIIIGLLAFAIRSMLLR